MPSPMNPTRTTGIGSVVSRSTECWPSTRAGASKTITPSTTLYPFGEDPQAVKKSAATTAHDKKANFFIYQ